MTAKLEPWNVIVTGTHPDRPQLHHGRNYRVSASSKAEAVELGHACALRDGLSITGVKSAVPALPSRAKRQARKVGPEVHGERIRRQDARMPPEMRNVLSPHAAVQRGLPENSLREFPSGRWGFEGKVSRELAYRHADGSPVSSEILADIGQSQNPAWTAEKHGVFRETWETATGACLEAAACNVPVTVQASMGAREDIAEALRVSGVRYKVL